jgi:hypothetical protein
MPKEPKDRVTELQPRAAVPTWNSMSPGEKMAWLLNQALDCKRDILTMSLPDRDDDSAEAIRLRALLLAAADSTIEQTIPGSCSRGAPARRDARSRAGQSLHLQNQRDEFALAMCVGLGKDRFQLIARRFP